MSESAPPQVAPSVPKVYSPSYTVQTGEPSPAPPAVGKGSAARRIIRGPADGLWLQRTVGNQAVLGLLADTNAGRPTVSQAPAVQRMPIRQLRDEIRGQQPTSHHQDPLNADVVDNVLTLRIANGDPDEEIDDKRVDAFRWLRRNKTVGSAWPSLDATWDVIRQQAAERLLQPWLVNQGQLATCGVATVLYPMLDHEPVTYVQLLIEVVGQGTVNGRPIGQQLLRASRAPNTPAADWVLMSAIRQTSNTIGQGMEGQEKLLDQLYQLSLPGDVARWLHDLVGFPQTRFYGPEFVDGMAHLRAIEALNAQLQTGNAVAAAFVNGDLLRNPHSKSILNVIPDHWVYLKRLVVFGGRIYMTTYTWGQALQRAYSPAQFRRAVRGFVIGAHNGVNLP